ncbi:RNA-directed DNA polymerase, eukaryota, nucleotide-binding alpha-beta plait domain protein, partial [Tanacetum coccineum]
MLDACLIDVLGFFHCALLDLPFSSLSFIGVLLARDGNKKSYRSKEDQTQPISHSIFVTNFPDHVTAHDLWKVCNDYGVLVDAFIPYKKSKAGKRFAFVRFIKVDNIDRLVANLCTIWIGRFHLHANVARFHRERKLSAPSYPSNANQRNSPGVESWFSSLKPACNSFISDERIVWISLEGLHLKVWIRNIFAKVASKWGLVYWVHAKEMKARDPFISNDSYESESYDDEEDAEDDGPQSGDKVTTDNNFEKDSGDDLKYPTGFTPSVINVDEVNEKEKGVTSNEVNEHVNSTSNKLEESVPKENFHRIIVFVRKRLSLEQQADLKRNVSNEEIKSAIWDCGMNKSLGPYGFTFELVHRYWKLLEHDIVATVKEFFAS